MNASEKNEIIGYLSGLRDYQEGVALYQRYGMNLRLKRLFASDDTANTRDILMEELRKLAGLSDVEFSRLPRRAASVKPQVLPDPAQKIRFSGSEECSDDPDGAPSSTGSAYEETPEPVKKMIRFREKFPFLSAPDCPDVLKVLVSDMFAAYDAYKAAHARLAVMADDDSAAAAKECETVVEEYLKNREIWAELEYYRDNGTILGKAAKFREMEAAEDYAAMPEMDLMKKLQSAQANESKQRKAVKAAADKGERNERAEAALERWSHTKRMLQAEVERRKKK